MKLTLPDGQVIERPFAAGAHGFVATKIEIGPDDIAHMREMAMSRPSDFYAHMIQLEFRFPERRQPTPSPIDGALKLMRSSAYGEIGNPDALKPGDYVTVTRTVIGGKVEIASVQKTDPPPPPEPQVTYSDPCPDCGTELVDGSGGGVRCPKAGCGYWFCY